MPKKSIAELLVFARTLLKDHPAYQSHALDLAAELALANVLKRPRTFLYAYPEWQCDVMIEEAFYQALEALRDMQPLAYLTQSKAFWGLDFKVTSATLVPRPETEVLLAAALAVMPEDYQGMGVDLGTGSGILGCCLAHFRTHAKVIAIERSWAALEVAKHNANHLCLQNIDFVCADWLTSLQPAQFDFIVANPPYIAPNDPCLAFLRHEPQSALVSEQDGFADLKSIVAQAKVSLKPGGWLGLEHGMSQSDAVQQVLREHAFNQIQTQKDLNGLPRVTSAYRSAL